MSTSIVNFMGGESFVPTPLERLKLLMYSGIFGEPTYYRHTERQKKEVPEFLQPFLLFDDVLSVENHVQKAIDEALVSDYEGTVSLLPVLRNQFMMRKNPQILAVRAVLHTGRVPFTATHGKALTKLLLEAIGRPDDIETQLEYLNSLRLQALPCPPSVEERKTARTAAMVPGILKRAWATKIEGFDRYRMMKYGTSLIDAIRLSHAKGPLVGELLKNGKVKGEEETTWERMRSAGKTWGEIVSHFADSTHNFPHMALLRNLRSLYQDETVTNDQLDSLLVQLLFGVPGGKQFPFRYYSAYKQVEDTERTHRKKHSGDEENKHHPDVEVRRQKVLDTLNSCIQKALENVPRLAGHTVALCDNSGSAWGAGPSEYSEVKIAEIANLGALMAVSVSGSGSVVPFGDRYNEYPLIQHDGPFQLLDMLKRICDESRDGAGNTKPVGMSTEAGIWQYLHKAIENKIHIDNLFIYSDMQAGTGNLYGRDVPTEYQVVPAKHRQQYINIPAMIEKYRKGVNPKMNVFSIQVAGYDNSVLPMYMYRGAILSGWTGAELTFASSVNTLWNEHDSKTTTA